MCGSMVDIQSATAEIRQGKKERKKKKKKKPQDENITVCPIPQGDDNTDNSSDREAMWRRTGVIRA